MPIQIQVPGIGVAEFPDGVSYDDAFKAIQEDNPEWQPSRADIFSKMQSDSNALASRDTNRFLKQEGDSGLQVAYERMAGNVTRGVGDILSAPVRLLEKPLDSYYAGERRAAKRTGADMPVTFEQSVRSSFDESADAAETATQGRGNAALNFGADVVGGIAPTLAATALTGGLGGAMFAGAQQFGSTRKRVLDYYKSLGLPDDDAQSTADMLGATSGAITGAVTKYTPEVLGKIPGIGKYIGGEGVEGMAKVLLTQRLRQTPVAEIARRAVGNSFGEATEESINQFLLEVVESKQLEPNLSWEEIAKRTAMAGAQGAAGGAGTSIVGDVSRAGVERLSGTTPQSEFEYFANVGRLENAKRELDKNRAARNELDTIREQSANELAEMAGFEKPHTEPRLPLPEPQRFTLPPPQPPTAIESEAVLLKQAEAARQAGQISDQEYLAAVDRFQQARAVNAAQPPPLPAPQTPNLSGGESTNEGQIQEKGLQVAPATTPPPSSVAGEVVQPQSQPNTSNAVSIQSPNEGMLRQGGQELGLQSLVQGNPQPQVPAGTQAKEAQGGSATGLESNPPDRIDAALSRAIEATNPFGKANTGNLGVTYTVLKLTRAAYRAGKSLANAIKESIAQYRASNPAAQFNDDEVEAGVRIKLQDFLAGGEDALAIAKAAEPAVAENERAAAMIHSEEYYRQRVRDKETELKKIRDDTLQAALGRGVDPSMVPGHMDEELANIADGVGLDAALIAQLQAEVKAEKKAFALSKLQEESEEINRTINTLAKLDPDKNVQVVEDLLKRKDVVDNEIADKKFDDVRIRAASILDFQREYVSRKARLEALNNPDVKEAISGPVQVLRDLMAEFPDLRDRGVSEWVSDPNITDEVKRVVVARLSSAFREFDKHHENVATELSASEASLERQINRLKERISKGEIRKAYINIVIEEARLALAGEEGLTGGRGKEYLAWFDANTEALRSFARSIAEKIDGTGQSAMDARKLSDWLIFGPTSAPPAIVNSARENWGVGDETLREIMKALQESPAIRNAVAAIFDKGSETIPAHTLQKIAELANTGDESDWDEAERLSKSLQKKQGTERAKVVQRLRTDAKNLLDARVRLETLREALKLFQSVEASPVFKDARIETETQEGSFTRQMFVGDENSMTLRGFSGPEINQPEINIGGLSSFKPETKTAIESWRRSAAQYIAMYDLAQIESDMNPLAPHPITLGFDQAVYRGLQTALEENNILVDPSTYDDGSRIDEYKGITKNGQSWAINRQIDATTRMVEGIFGKNWQQKNKRYRDTKLKSVEILHNHGNGNIPALLSKAMASHPKIGGAEWLKAVPKFGPWFNETFAPGGNVSAYRRRVFDQIAHAARGNFVDSPKVGDVLPSGEVVTQADLDLVDQAIKYSNGLLKIAQDKRGTIQNFGTKELRRPAASVGVKGMARHIGVRGNGFVNAMLEAFKGNKDVSEFSPSDDLANGTSPWIQFWNTKAIHDDVLTNHVLDSVRGDRAITVSPYMRTAYEGLAANLIAEKYANRISNLEDLVAKLQVYFPSGTGLSAREYIIGELGKEFGQYVAQAKARKESIEKAELALNPISTDPNASKDLRKKSSSIVESETMNNEFTKPAADLILPSVYYEYGAITPTEMALAKDRATSEATIEMKHAMREAYAALYSYKVSIQDAANTDPLLADERDRVGFIMQQIHNLDLDIGRDLQQLNDAQKALKSGGSLLVGTALTAVGAVAGNVMSSGLPAYIFASRVSRLNRMALTMLAIKQSVRATKNLAYVLIDKAVGGYASSAFKALAKSKNPAMVMVADSITSMMDRAMKITGFMDAAGNWKDGRNDGYIQRGMQWAGFTNAAGVKSLGLSQTDRFISEVFNDVRGILQYANDEEQSKYRGALGKARLTGKVAAGVTASTIRNFSKMVGLESGDLAVNMASLSISDFMGRDLKDLAKRWATDRIAKIGDKFDESSKDWEVKPDEWLSGRYNREADQQNRLAGLRVAMSESGNQLENALWDYWKRSEGGTKDVDFFKDPDAFNRVVIGAVNANVYTNRPQRAQTNADQSMFQTLMNYTSDLAVKVMSAMKSVKSAKGMRKWFEILMRAIWGSIAALLVGLTTGAAREFVNRRFASKISREMTPMDKEFWTPDENLSKRLAMAAAYVLPGGQTFVNLAQLGRPDAASGNFWVSAINSVTAFLMGAMRIQSQDLPWLAKRALIKHFPFMEVILSNTSVNDTRQIGSGVNAYASAAKMAGIDRQNDAANAAGQQFTEKTPILAKINEAGMRAQIAREKGDSEALAEAKADIERERNRLIQFHKDALIKDNKRRGITMSDFKVDQESIAAARKDWLSLNPLTKALGHQPTSTEMERISAYLSGDRKAAFDRAWNSYSGLAEFFPNGKGVANEPEMVKQERIAGLGRSGGGLTGGMSVGSLSASLRGGGGSVGVRRSGLRSRRGGISRLSRGVRSRRRSRGRTRGVRRIRF